MSVQFIVEDCATGAPCLICGVPAKLVIRIPDLDENKELCPTCAMAWMFTWFKNEGASVESVAWMLLRLTKALDAPMESSRIQ